jgi:hypothetical protein
MTGEIGRRAGRSISTFRRARGELVGRVALNPRPVAR